jgi:putative CRISPR-associated protein (TIGR02619 family)
VGKTVEGLSFGVNIMKMHFIVSVGTSIIGNYEKDRTSLGLSRTAFRQSGIFDNSSFPIPGIFCSYYNSIVDDFKDEEYWGAEQKSIEKVKKEKFKEINSSDCHYHLISTDTAECLFCASHLGHEVLKNTKVTYYVPLGLGAADDAQFVDIGLPSLLSCVAGILNRVEEQDDEATIIPTGGYKAIIPYLTIASILYTKPAYYIYEDSDTLIKLPAPPLSVDTASFRLALVLLENIAGLNEKEATPYFEALSESFQKLVYVNQERKYEYNAFGERLKNMFAGQTLRSPLEIRAAGNTLIPRLGKYKDTFRNMTRLGDTVWLGDKAPEMADHARHHHINLFAYAELLLLPILKNMPHFLSSEELFLLLGMVYLHDCGHSLSSLPISSGRIPLLPTEIRIFHNLLGFLRLQDNVFQQALQRQGIQLSNFDFNNIATLSVYHRKKMPLLNGCCTGPEGTEIELKPLSTISMIHNEEKIEGKRLALLAALFRIIDGMDKQVGRAGDANEVTMKAEAILADLPHLRDRAIRIGSMLSSLAPDAKEKADQILNQIIDDYGLKESAGSNKDHSQSCSPCYGCEEAKCQFECKSPGNFSEVPEYLELKKALNGTKLEIFFSLAWEYLEARVRFFFQALQPSYYYSDLLLGMPKVIHSSSDGKRHITINFPENRDVSHSREKIEEVWEEIKKWISDKIEKDAPEQKIQYASLQQPEQIVQVIRDEYCSKKYSEVAKILKDADIIVVFQYNGHPVPCWKIRQQK